MTLVLIRLAIYGLLVLYAVPILFRDFKYVLQFWGLM